MDTRRAYGLVMAVGARIGERARDEPGVLARLRAPEDADAFRIAVRLLVGERLPAAVLDAFLLEVVQEDDWAKWRARLVVQAKMVRDGGQPAPGHEGGRGVGKP